MAAFHGASAASRSPFLKCALPRARSAFAAVETGRRYGALVLQIAQLLFDPHRVGAVPAGLEEIPELADLVVALLLHVELVRLRHCEERSRGVDASLNALTASG